MNLATLTTNLNSVCSIKPETATPEQMIYNIQLSIKILKDTGFTAEATSFSQQLQTLLSSQPQNSGTPWTLVRCGLTQLLADIFLILAGVILVSEYILELLHLIDSGTATLFDLTYYGLLGLAGLLKALVQNHCPYTPNLTSSTNGCSLPELDNIGFPTSISTN
jgi:hypothetical protein